MKTKTKTKKFNYFLLTPLILLIILGVFNLLGFNTIYQFDTFGSILGMILVIIVFLYQILKEELKTFKKYVDKL